MLPLIALERTTDSFTRQCRHLVWLPEVLHSSAHVFVLPSEKPRHIPATPVWIVHRYVRVDVVHGQVTLNRYLEGPAWSHSERYISDNNFRSPPA